MKFNLNIGTFNVRGLSKQHKQEQLSEDLNKYKLDVICIQETKVQISASCEIGDNRLILFESQSQHYGNGFLVSKKWKDNIEKYWRISDRISILQLRIDSQKDDTKQQDESINYKIQESLRTVIAKTDFESEHQGEVKLKIKWNRTIRQPEHQNKLKITADRLPKPTKKRKLITIINVYAPTNYEDNTNEVELMYQTLNNLLDEWKQSFMIILAGDWNARVGKRTNENDVCLGRYSRGTRNNSGQCLVNFCLANDLFIANSAFKHKACHITTWESKRNNPNNNKITNIYSQIDYVLCQSSMKNILIDSRSYSGTLTSSDHKLVVCKMKVEPYKMHKPQIRNHKKPFNTTDLVSSTEVRERYCEKLTEELKDIESPTWDIIAEKITNVAEETLGFKKSHKQRKTFYPEIEELSNRQKQIRLQISNTNDAHKLQNLKTRRNLILHQIENRLNELKSAELDRMADNIEEFKDNIKMFKALKQMNRKPYETPTVHDANGKMISNPQDVYDAIKTHFENHFHKPEIEDLKMFESEVPKALTKPVTWMKLVKQSTS